MFYKKTFCNFAILQFGDLGSIEQGITYTWNFSYNSYNNVLSLTRGSEQTRRKYGGKWRFPPRKVRLYPEESQRPRKAHKKATLRLICEQTNKVYKKIRKQFSNNREESNLPSVFMCLNPEGFDAAFEALAIVEGAVLDAGAIVVDSVNGVMQELGNL